MRCSFYQVDVFTNIPFGGNPLAVVFDIEGLTSNTMQNIAREMNLSETTFVSPPGNLPVDFCIRIFTPEKELPFAGHPTLGAAHILRETGKVPHGDYSVKLAMKAGIVTITQETKENLLFMTQPLPEFQLPLDCTEEVGEALGIPTSNIKSAGYPMQIVSTGLPALLVPIISLKALESIVINTNRLSHVLASLGTDMIYAFTDETIHPKATIHSRAFAPRLGIAEDPATGSAAGAMGAYIYKNNIASGEELKNIFIEQGYKMGRPSSLYVEINQEADEIKSIRVGGESVTVIEGCIKT